MMKRRKFLTLGLGAVGAATLLPYEWLPGMKPLYASGRRRRHLVNLICYGGWDSSWMHNAFSRNALVGVDGAYISSSTSGFEHEHENDPFKYTQKTSDSTESDLGTHPDGQSRLGPGMRTVFESDAEYSDFLIWRGLNPAGGHGFGNNLILQGNSSSYAIGYAALISEALAEIDRRPLHYVLMAQDPTSLFTNFAMNKGDQIPICVPGRDQFEELTEVARDDLSDTRLRELLSRTVTTLSEAGLRDQLKRAPSKVSAGSFANSFGSASQIYGSNMLADPLFKWLRKYYLLAIARAYRRASEDANISGRASEWEYSYATRYSGILSEIGSLETRLTPLPDLEGFLANPAPHLAALEEVNSIWTVIGADNYSPYTPSFVSVRGLETSAFNYAMADYLIRSNHTAVIDLPGWPGLCDAHGGAVGTNLDELLNMIATFALFRAMIRSFKRVPLPEGGTLFDATLIALHTEFDRWPYHNARGYTNAGYNPGTNHADTASVVLAGMGIQGGRVVGRMHEGPKIHGAEFGDGYLRPLPIDVRTGLPLPVSQGGRVISTLAVMPTIMAAFGVAIPLQQITDWEAIPAVLRPT
jgi:hypothetical protein